MKARIENAEGGNCRLGRKRNPASSHPQAVSFTGRSGPKERKKSRKALFMKALCMRKKNAESLAGCLVCAKIFTIGEFSLNCGNNLHGFFTGRLYEQGPDYDQGLPPVANEKKKRRAIATSALGPNDPAPAPLWVFRPPGCENPCHGWLGGPNFSGKRLLGADLGRAER